jgi:hypothetical protein
MTLISQSAIREVSGIEENDKERIRNFLQGAVYCWCNIQGNNWFSLRDLMGGDNSNWDGTPLFALYQKQENAGLSDPAAIEQAGKEGGWLLKRVISDDRRSFDTRIAELIRQYQWIPSV